MPAPHYDLVQAKLVAILKASPTIHFALGQDIETHVSDEWQFPTADQCPAVYAYAVRLPRQPLHLVGGPSIGAPYQGRYEFEIHIWAFSAQGTADASRQCRTVIEATENVLRGNPTLDRMTLMGNVTSVLLDFQTPKDGGGLFAHALLQYDTLHLF